MAACLETPAFLQDKARILSFCLPPHPVLTTYFMFFLQQWTALDTMEPPSGSYGLAGLVSQVAERQYSEYEEQRRRRERGQEEEMQGQEEGQQEKELVDMLGELDKLHSFLCKPGNEIRVAAVVVFSDFRLYCRAGSLRRAAADSAKLLLAGVCKGDPPSGPNQTCLQPHPSAFAPTMGCASSVLRVRLSISQLHRAPPDPARPAHAFGAGLDRQQQVLPDSCSDMRLFAAGHTAGWKASPLGLARPTASISLPTEPAAAAAATGGGADQAWASRLLFQLQRCLPDADGGVAHGGGRAPEAGPPAGLDLHPAQWSPELAGSDWHAAAPSASLAQPQRQELHWAAGTFQLLQQVTTVPALLGIVLTRLISLASDLFCCRADGQRGAPFWTLRLADLTPASSSPASSISVKESAHARHLLVQDRPILVIHIEADEASVGRLGSLKLR